MCVARRGPRLNRRRPWGSNVFHWSRLGGLVLLFLLYRKMASAFRVLQRNPIDWFADNGISGLVKSNILAGTESFPISA